MSEDTNWLDDLNAISGARGGVSRRATSRATSSAARSDATDATQAQRDTRHHIARGEYDGRMLARALDDATFAQSAANASAQLGGDIGDALVEDVLSALFSANPLTQPVDAAHQHSADVLDATMRDAEWAQLHATTTHDELLARLSAPALIDAAVARVAQLRRETARDAQEQQQEQQQESNDAQSDAQSDADDAQSGASAGADEDSGDAASDGSASSQPAQRGAASSSEQQEQQGQQTSAASAASAREQREQDAETRNVMRAALDAALDAAEQQQTAEALLVDAGWSQSAGAGGGQSDDVAQRARLARELASNTMLQDVMKLAGRLRFVANAAQRKRVKHVPDREFGVTRGNALADVLPSEFALLAHPTLKKLFYAKYATSELLQADHRGKQEQGRGPIVACIDTSYSMNASILPPLKRRASRSGAAPLPSERVYTCHAWAHAVALCLLMIARQQKRDFRLVLFASAYELMTLDFPKGMGDADALLLAATFKYDGGTDFEAPLSAALESVETSAYKRADVIFITDGIASLSPQFLTRWADARRAKQMRCHGLLISAAQDVASASSASSYEGYGLGVLRAFCDDAERLVTPGGDDDADALSASFSI